MAFTMLLITILFISVIQVAIPFLIKRTVVFGVTIPYEQASHPVLQSYKRKYATLTFLVGIAVMISYILGNQSGMEETKLVLFGMISLFVVLLTSLSLYFYFHYKTMRLKKREEWFRGVKQVRVADLALRSKDEMLPSFVHLIPTLITITLVILTAQLFDQLPNQIPTHWGPNGQPDAFTDKSWMSVISLPLILFIFQTMFFGINYYTKRSGIKLNAANITSTKLRQLRLRKYTSWFLFITNLLLTILFSFLQLNLLYENLFNDSTLMLVPFAFFAIVLAGALGLAIKVGKVDSDLEGTLVMDHTKKQDSVDEDQYWKGGLIYYNPNDPSIFVEKRFGIGYTINLANPIGYLILLLPVALILLIQFTI